MTPARAMRVKGVRLDGRTLARYRVRLIVAEDRIIRWPLILLAAPKAGSR